MCWSCRQLGMQLVHPVAARCEVYLTRACLAAQNSRNTGTWLLLIAGSNIITMRRNNVVRVHLERQLNQGKTTTLATVLLIRLWHQCQDLTCSTIYLSFLSTLTAFFQVRVIDTALSDYHFDLCIQSTSRVKWSSPNSPSWFARAEVNALKLYQKIITVVALSKKQPGSCSGWSLPTSEWRGWGCPRVTYTNLYI